MALPFLYGSIPRGFPRGVHFRVGPDVSADPSEHMLDAQGRIDRASFEGDRVTLLSRRVVTPGGGRPTFGKGGRGFALRNPANTALLFHDGRLYAMWEGGRPTEVHPGTLETLANDVPLAGARPGLPLSIGALDRLVGLGGEAVGSHPCFDTATTTTAVLLSTIARGHVNYRIAEIEKTAVVRESSFKVNGFTAVHGGLSVTRDYCVAFAPALRLDWRACLGGSIPIADCVEHLPEPTAIHLVPRRGAPALTVRAERCFVTHTVNAYQTRTGHVVVDAMAADSLAQLKKLNVEMRRFVVDTGAARVDSFCIRRGPIEFPSINPNHAGRPYAFAYASVSPWGWCKTNVDTGETLVATCGDGPHAEPTFVPRDAAAAEDDGWLVGYVLSPQGIRLCVVDARTMTLCCKLDARGANAMGLHGVFVRQ